MKDFIYINYGLKVNKIYNNYFFVGNDKVYIYRTLKNEKELEKLFNITNDMYTKRLLVDTFLINKNNKYYTKKDKENIVLLKENDRDSKVTLKYLMKYIDFKLDIDEFDIIEYWKSTIDDIEELLVEYNKEHLLLQDSVNYFIGMSENAITLMNQYEKRISNDIAHNINYYNYSNESFNNPFNFIRLNKLYDISLYIKYNFYIDNIDYDEIYNILNSIDDEYDEAFLFSCLLYRNFYFDVVLKIIKEDEDDEKLKLFINKIKKYEELLSFCRQNLKKCKWLALINWLN